MGEGWGPRRVWISAALCLTEGDDDLIGRLVSYPSDSLSETGCTYRYKIYCCQRRHDFGEFLLSAIITVLPLNQGRSRSLQQTFLI